MNTRMVSMCILASLFLLTTISQPAKSNTEEITSDVEQVSDIDRISTQLLAKEIELLKLNTRLKLYLLPHNPWSTRRLAGIGFTNSTLTAIGAFMNGAGRMKYLYKPSKAPAPLFEDAGIVRFLANCITVGGAVFEFCDDGLADFKERKHDISLPMMHNRAVALQHEIDGLLRQRQSMLSNSSNQNESMTSLQQEGKVFTDLRNAEANEFASYYAQAKGNKAARRLSYLITIVSNVTSGAGTLVGIEANHLHGINKVRRNHMGGVGGICDIVSGSMNILSPIATRGGAALERRLVRNKIDEELDCERSDSLEALHEDQRLFETTLSRKPVLDVHGVILRNESLHTAGLILDKRYEMRMAEKRAARNQFIENFATASVAGGSKIANGIGGTVGAFKFPRDSFHRYEVQGGTAIAYGAGNALAALETARVRMSDEYKTYKNRGSKTSKKAILNQQLEQLDALRTGPQLAGDPAKQTL